MKNIKVRDLAVLIVCSIMMVGLVSCEDDDVDTPDQTVEAEAESAWVLGGFSVTPQGEIFYMKVSEEIPSQFDVSNAVEIGANSGIGSVGEHPYTWNANAGTVTKWNVDKTTLELSVGGILSLANTGVAFNEPLFISETQAFISSLAEGLIVEWNPSTMEVTKIHNVDPLPVPDGQLGYYSEFYKYTSNGKIFMPINISVPEVCCDYFSVGTEGAMVAVFDPASSSIKYERDSRIRSARDDFPIDENGNFYLYPNRTQFFVEPYFNVDVATLPAHNKLLRFNEDGTFDPGFEFDLSSVLPDLKFHDTPIIFGNEVILPYVGDNWDWPADYDNRWTMYADGAFQSVLINMDTKEVNPFTAFDKYSTNFLINNFDGKSYRTARINVPGELVTVILEQESATEFREITTYNGGAFRHIDQLWGE